MLRWLTNRFRRTPAPAPPAPVVHPLRGMGDYISEVCPRKYFSAVLVTDKHEPIARFTSKTLSGLCGIRTPVFRSGLNHQTWIIDPNGQVFTVVDNGIKDEVLDFGEFITMSSMVLGGVTYSEYDKA